MIEFTMPSLGADMEAGTLIQWLKRPGERFERGEALAVVETQKGAIEIENYHCGVLEEILVEVGQKVPVGQPLALLRLDSQADEKTAASPPPAKPAVKAEAAPGGHPLPTRPRPTAAAPGYRPRISPAALVRMQSLGLSPERIAAGPDGAIGLREVDAAARRLQPDAGPESPAPTASRGIAPDDMRKAIAAAMSRSHREIPHYFVGSRLDIGPLVAWLEAENTGRETARRLLYAAPLIRALALAFKCAPALNGHWVDDGFVPAESVHLGVAIALRGGGLIAPALLDADRLGVDEIMLALTDLVARARGGRLRSAEMTAATATVSILGDATADSLQPIIYPPQVAIVGCGRIVETAWAENGVLSARPSLTVTIGGDHRVSDGRLAAKFLNRLDTLLKQPEKL